MKSAVESGEPFDLVIEFETREEGISANLKAQPQSNFIIEPSEVSLPRSPDGGAVTVSVVVKRLKEGLPECLIRAKVGSTKTHGSVRVV